MRWIGSLALLALFSSACTRLTGASVSDAFVLDASMDAAVDAPVDAQLAADLDASIDATRDADVDATSSVQARRLFCNEYASIACTAHFDCCEVAARIFGNPNTCIAAMRGKCLNLVDGTEWRDTVFEFNADRALAHLMRMQTASESCTFDVFIDPMSVFDAVVDGLLPAGSPCDVAPESVLQHACADGLACLWNASAGMSLCQSSDTLFRECTRVGSSEECGPGLICEAGLEDDDRCNRLSGRGADCEFHLQCGTGYCAPGSPATCDTPPAATVFCNDWLTARQPT